MQLDRKLSSRPLSGSTIQPKSYYNAYRNEAEYGLKQLVHCLSLSCRRRSCWPTGRASRSSATSPDPRTVVVRPYRRACRHPGACPESPPAEACDIPRLTRSGRRRARPGAAERSERGIAGSGQPLPVTVGVAPSRYPFCGSRAVSPLPRVLATRHRPPQLVGG